MSLSQTVFLQRTKLPTRDEWQRALTHHGFPLVLDHEWNPADTTGFAPCTFAGVETGFECFIQDIETYLAEQECPERRVHIGARNTAVSFVTRGRHPDLQAAMAAAAVLVTLSDGMLWSDEAGDFLDDVLDVARGLSTEEPPRPPPPLAAPESIDVDLAVRCVFRGQAMTILETSELTPRRFTIKLAVPDGDTRVVALWKHAIGNPTVHRLSAGSAVHEFAPRGGHALGKSVLALIAELGTSPSAADDLLHAGTDAVLPLCELLRDAMQPTHVRNAAISVLGKLGDRRAAPTLEQLGTDSKLGNAARRALAKLS